MARVRIHNAGKVGIISDTPAHELPPEAWTDGINVRMLDGAVWKFFGYTEVLSPPPGVGPYSLIPTQTQGGAQLFAYPAIERIWATDGAVHAEITRGTGVYSSTPGLLWNGGSTGQIVIINNGEDIPQAWIGPSLGIDLVDLPNWPIDIRAKVVRPFKNFWVAYDVTFIEGRVAQMVKWSERAEPNAVPVDWDFGNPRSRAGEWALNETAGAVIDALPLADTNFVYKEDEIHAMDEIGGNFTFAFKKRFGQVGLLAQRCVKLYQQDAQLIHVLMTHDDIVMHDGFQMSSLLDNKMRRWYAGRNDLSVSHRCWLTPNYSEDEMWAGITEAGEDYPNLALVLNMKDGTTSIRELPGIAHIAWAQFDPSAGATTFDSQTIPFDEMIGQFGQRPASVGRKRLIMVHPLSTTQFLLADEGFTRNGNIFGARIERKGLAVVGRDRFGQPKVDTEVIKCVTEVWPRIRILNGNEIQIQVGSHEKLEGDITWNAPNTFNVETMDKIDVDPPVSGRFIAIRFLDNSAALWKLDGYDLEMHLLGHY